MACGFCEKTDGLKKISIKIKIKSSFSDSAFNTNFNLPPSYIKQLTKAYGVPQPTSDPSPSTAKQDYIIYQCQMCEEYTKKDGTRLGYDLEQIKKDLGG